MATPPSSNTGATISRRAALKSLAVLAAAGVGAACTPIRMGLRLAPGGFDNDKALVDRVLRGFATAVVTGTPADHPNLVRHFYDNDYPLAKYRGYLASDLCQACVDRFGTHEFDRLSLAQRTKIIESKLARGGVTRRLYRGAIYLTQIACYAGIYDPDGGSPLIDFDGRCRNPSVADSTYPMPHRFLSHETTPDGNPF